MTGIRVPWDQLSREAFYRLVEEFVTRDGTDYGAVEVSTETKIAQVTAQIRSGKAVIVFDPVSETCNILRGDDPALKKIDG